MLAALLGLGAAGIARSSSAVAAACATLGRFPFPHFRVLPCLGRGADDAAGAAAIGTTGLTPQSEETPAVPPLARGQVAPDIAGVLGARVLRVAAPALRGWELLKTVVLAMLVVANALLLAIRWRLGLLEHR
jgi:hypothetical protein